jgi:hypothetical protein
VPRWAAATGGAGGAEVGARHAATAGALDAPGLGVHQGGVGAASGRSCRCRGVGTPQGTGRSCTGRRRRSAVVGLHSPGVYLDRDFFRQGEANNSYVRDVSLATYV